MEKEFCFLLNLEEEIGRKELLNLESKGKIGKILVKELEQWYLISTK